MAPGSTFQGKSNLNLLATACQAPELLTLFLEVLILKNDMQLFSQGAGYNIEWRAKNTGTTLYVVWWYSSHKRTERLETPYQL